MYDKNRKLLYEGIWKNGVLLNNTADHNYMAELKKAFVLPYNGLQEVTFSNYSKGTAVVKLTVYLSDQLEV